MRDKKKIEKFVLRPLAVATTLALCSNVATAASLNGSNIGNTVTNETLTNNGSGKFVIGQGDVIVNTSSSLSHILGTLDGITPPQSPKELLSALRKALQPTKENGTIVGLVGGEGQIDSNTKNMLGLDVFGYSVKEKIDGKFGTGTTDKILNINTAAADNKTISGDSNVVIGGKTSDGKESEPIVFGTVGGDLSIGINASTLLKNDAVSINRAGSVNMQINSGNVFGGTGGSAAISVGNISATINNVPIIKTVNVKTNGNTTTTLNGNVTVGVNNGANIAGFANGGAAIAIGGKATSIVNGTSNLSIDNSKLDKNNIEGISLGVSGGGLALSTLGSTATSKVSGSSNIDITDGLSIGTLGGGIASSIDATLIGDLIRKAPVGNDNGTSDTTIGGVDVVLSDVYNGGTATSYIGDTNINLNGTNTSMLTVGGGLALASHNYLAKGDQGYETQKGQPIGTSTAITSAGKSTINVNLTGATDKTKDELMSLFSPDGLNKNSLKDIVYGFSGKSAALGVIGGGVAIASGDDELTSDTDIISSTAKSTNAGAEINLIKGYVVGSFGGGLTAALNNANASHESTGDVVTNVSKDAEVVAAFGNGLAYYLGSSNGGQNNLHGLSSVTATNTTMNIDGSVDGVVGGGLVIDDSQSDVVNAKADTTGTSTINILDNAKVQQTQLVGLKTIAESMGLGNVYTNFSTVAKNISIAGGSVVLGGGAQSTVNKSVINVAGGEVKGDIIAGGIAVNGYSDKDSNVISGSFVNDSTVNLVSGKVDGSVYAGGAVNITGDKDKAGYIEAKSHVGNSVINWSGTEITGQLSGQGAGDASTLASSETAQARKATVGFSTLNINGTTIKALADKSKITGFNSVVFTSGSESTIEGLDANNTVALIDGSLGAGKKGTIKTDGSRLNITKLNPLEIEGDKYFIATNYDAANSSLWSNADLAFDRTAYYAQTEETSDNKYNITYKKLTDASAEEKAQAVNDFVDSYGSSGKKARGIIEGIVNNGAATNEGATGFFSDTNQYGNTAQASSDLKKALLFGELSGVTSNTVNMASDIAESAFLRLSFTQDSINGPELDTNGALWVKYLHNKYDVDGMSSSFGDLNSSNTYDGVTLGLDSPKFPNGQAGIALSYVNGDGDGYGVDNDYDMWGITAYGNINNEFYNFITDIGYSEGDNDLKGFAVNGKRLKADRDLSVLSIGTRLESMFKISNNQLVPYVGLRYMNVNSDKYTTYYNGQEAFSNDADDLNIWTVPVGLNFRNETRTQNGWTITPNVNVAYICAFGDTDNDVTVNAGSGASSLNYDVIDSGSYLGSVGLEAGYKDFRFGAGYSYQKGNDADSNKFFVDLNYSF